jgi:hypothetical protein
MKRILLLVFVVTISLSTAVQAQTRWYKFNKKFVADHYQKDSAIGEVEASEVFPGPLHAVTCGGKDGELHFGVPGNAIVWNHADNLPVSAKADDSGGFGIIPEPVNLTAETLNAANNLEGKPAKFKGYFRVFDEGHTGTGPASNPAHVLELHPAWEFHGEGSDMNDPASIHPMKNKAGRPFQGFGASKFRPLLQDLNGKKWLEVYEDDDFIYVELPKSSNFFQLPVTIRSAHKVSGGVEALADIYSDSEHTRLVLKNLHIVANAGSPIAKRLLAGDKPRFLLGIFSVNLNKAAKLASGHQGKDHAVFAPTALEFFTYGVPLGNAVLSSKCDEDPEDNNTED